MKILLIGKTGQLGNSLIAINTKFEIVAPERSELDLESNEDCQRAINKHQPDLVINTAAFHNVPQCEKQSVRAFAVNCEAVRNLATLCKQHDIQLITFSSDYVFNGDKNSPYVESDQAEPIQMYGITRLAGELAVLTTAPRHAIVIRTCGLYGASGAVSKGGNFVDNRIADAESSTKMEMGCDQVISPTSASDLANAVFQLIENPEVKPGIYHLVNEGECSWYEFTKAIYELMNIVVELTPVDRKGMSGDMRRPLYTVLKNTKAAAIGITLPHWREALKRYLFSKYEQEINNN